MKNARRAKNHRHFTALAGFITFITLVAPVSINTQPARASDNETHASTVWLCPDAPLKRATKFNQSDYDYMAMFAPDAPWSQAAKNVKVFKVGEQFILRTPDDQLSKIFADLNRRGIALAMEAGLLDGNGNCGKGVEGYASPLSARVASEKIARLGGKLSFIAMDEPLWFGCHFSGPNACHSTMKEVAADIAAKLTDVKKVFPQIKLGDIEPVAPANVPDWNNQILQWTQVFEEQVGQPLAFFHADIDWTGPWQQTVPALHKGLKQRHVPMGIIYDGYGGSDAEWSGHALENAIVIEDVLHVQPNDAIIQTWAAYPKYVLPETKPNTLTNLVCLYAADPSRIEMRQAQGNYAGQILQSNGHPLGNVTVMLRTAGGANTARAGLQKIDGIIPPNASKAVFGLRISANTSRTPVTLAVQNMRFIDNNTDETVSRQLALPANVAGQNGKVNLAPGQKIGPNSPPFTVHAGHPFTFTAILDVPVSFQGKGLLAVVFLDNNGKQISYQPIDLKYKAGENSVIVARTKSAADGTFNLPKSASSNDATQPCFVEFVGGPYHRMTRSADLQN